MATREIDTKLIGDLIDACSDVNARSRSQGPSPLAKAVISENVEAMELLLAKGAEVNTFIEIDTFRGADKTTVLELGANSGRIDILGPLLQACMNINPEVEYLSPLALAAGIGDFQCTELLLKAGMDTQVADNGWGMNLVEKASWWKNVELCRMLINYGAKVDRPLSNGEKTSFALMIAVQKNALDVVGLLIRRGHG